MNQAYAASEANPTEMTSMVSAPAREVAGNGVIAGVHGQVEDNTTRDESNQGDLPEDLRRLTLKAKQCVHPRLMTRGTLSSCKMKQRRDHRR